MNDIGKANERELEKAALQHLVRAVSDVSDALRELGAMLRSERVQRALRAWNAYSVSVTKVNDAEGALIGLQDEYDLAERRESDYARGMMGYGTPLSKFVKPEDDQ